MTRGKKARRDYRDADGKKLPGVTTVMGATLGWKCDPLMWWAARLGAEAAATEAMRLGFFHKPATMEEAKPHIDAAVALGRKAHVMTRDRKADLGKIAHALVESVLTGEPFEDEEGWGVLVEQARPNAERIVKHIEAKGLKPLHIERAFIGPGFGGTVDLICRDANGEHELVDLKTGGVREEVCVQLGAYAGLTSLEHVHIARAHVIQAKQGEDIKTIKISRQQLEVGGMMFAALFMIYSNKKLLEVEPTE